MVMQCVDVTLAEPEDVEQVTPQNCYNSTDIGFNLVFTTEALTGAANLLSGPSTTVVMVAGMVMLGFAFVL